MSIQFGVNSITYVGNAIVFLGLAAFIARVGPTDRFRPLRVAALTVLLLADACALLMTACNGMSMGMLAVLVCVAATTFPAALTSGLSEALGRARFGLYVTSVLTVAALFYIYLPITTFLTSPGELSIHLEYLLTTNAKACMVVVYCACALYAAAFSARLKSVLTLLAVSALLLTFVYAYVYPFGYPMMNGLMFEQIPVPRSSLMLRGAVDALSVPCGVLLVAWGLFKFGGPRILPGVVLLNVALCLSAVVTAANDSADLGGAGTSDGSEADAQPLRFARDKNNTLLLFLDRFMGGFVEEILAEEPQLLSDLEGFTWYPRTVAPGENSVAGVHALLGGYDYTPREMNKRNRLLRDLSVESFAILPHNFTNKGYAANLVNPHGLGFTMAGDCAFLDMPGLHCSHVPASLASKLAAKHGMSTQALSKSMYADLLVLLGVMRGTPYMVRAVVHEFASWRKFLDHSAGTTFRQWAELKSLPTLSRTDAKESNLNVFFNALPHEPYFIGNDCMPKKRKLSKIAPKARARHTSLFSYQHYVTARCALLLVADYMRWMRQEGVYDNTKIVIVSDHGIVGLVEDRSSRAQAGRTTSNTYVRSRSVLLVKERNAHGPLQINEEFLPNAEAPRILCEEIGGCVNPYLNNKSIEAHGRRDPFYVDFVPWQFNLQKPNAFTIRSEMVLRRGDPYEAKNWSGDPRPDL